MVYIFNITALEQEFTNENQMITPIMLHKRGGVPSLVVLWWDCGNLQKKDQVFYNTANIG